MKNENPNDGVVLEPWSITLASVLEGDLVMLSGDPGRVILADLQHFAGPAWVEGEVMGGGLILPEVPDDPPYAFPSI